MLLTAARAVSFLTSLLFERLVLCFNGGGGGWTEEAISLNSSSEESSELDSTEFKLC